MIVLTVVFGIGLVGSLLWAWKLYNCKSGDGYGGRNEAHVAFWVLALCFFLGLCVVSVKIAQAKVEAEMYNARYGTEYTTTQVFWGRASIGQILEGDRRRIEADLNINME